MPVFTGTITAFPISTQQLYQNAAEQTRDPNSGDNFTAGYALLMRWVRTDTEKEWVCTGNGQWTEVTGGTTTFGGLTDVTITSQARGDIIKVDAAGTGWENLAVGGANTVLRSDGTDPAWGQVAIGTDVSGLGTGVATALGIAVGTSGAFVVQDGALGTPSSGTLTNCTGLPTGGLLDDAVTLAKMASGTAGNLISYDASGNPAAVATGTATHVLTSNGAGLPPTFQAAAGGLAIGNAISGGTANRVLYEDGGNVLQESSNLVFIGSTASFELQQTGKTLHPMQVKGYNGNERFRIGLSREVAVDNNLSGGDTIIAPGVSTGNATPGTIRIKSSSATISGSGQQTDFDLLTLSDRTVVLDGQLISSRGTNTSNFFLGTGAGNRTTSGTSNVAMGGGSPLSALTSGSQNMAIGASALLSNSSGSGNVAIGPQSLQFNTTTSNNVAIGQLALQAANLGNCVGIGDSTKGYLRDVAIGSTAGVGHTTGIYCIYIGSRSGTTGAYQRSITLGESSRITADYQLMIGENSSYINEAVIGAGDTSATAGARTLNLRTTNGTGSNIDGSDFTITAGRPTGTGDPGTLKLRAAIANGAATALGAIRDGITIDANTTDVLLGFFHGTTPVAQPSSTGETAGFTAGAGTGVNDDSTFTGNVGSTAYRISDVVKHLKNLGLLAA